MNILISNNYKQLWSDDVLQSRIDEGIRRNRQSDAVIRVKDFDGKPLPGARIEIKQYDSEFYFGSNIFKLKDFENDVLNQKYEEAFCDLFNAATVPFYWRTLEPEQGRPRFSKHSVPIARRPSPDGVVEFCQERGLRMHGHTLVWHMRKWAIPDWLPENPEAAAPYWEKRIKEIAERYGNHIKRWDVLNEAVVDYKGIGQPMQQDYELQSFKWAEKYLPEDSRFDINETTSAWDLSCSKYTQLIERLIRAKLPLGGIGIQFHLFSDEELSRMLSGEDKKPEELFRALDHYAKFGLPIHVSEITLPSALNDEESLKDQATAACNLYRLWFSHPSVEGITWWNFPDGAAAPGEELHSGLLFEDMTPKPAYYALQDLIHREWRTELKGVTDTDGCFRFRGFHGTYNITTDTGIQSAITLEPGKNSEQMIHQ